MATVPGVSTVSLQLSPSVSTVSWRLSLVSQQFHGDCPWGRDSFMVTVPGVLTVSWWLSLVSRQFHGDCPLCLDSVMVTVPGVSRVSWWLSLVSRQCYGDCPWGLDSFMVTVPGVMPVSRPKVSFPRVLGWIRVAWQETLGDSVLHCSLLECIVYVLLYLLCTQLFWILQCTVLHFIRSEGALGFFGGFSIYECISNNKSSNNNNKK